MTTPAEFLSRVMPPLNKDEATYFTTITTTGEAQQRALHDQTAILTAAKAAYKKDRNIYFTPAAYADKGRRTADNVLRKRALHLDIDYGEGKHYADLPHLLRDFRRFLSATDYPDPTCLVSTGNGVHAYWILDTPVPASKWSQLSLGLKQLCKANGLYADHQVTADLARILRLPGTLNYKHSPPAPCTVVHLDPDDLTLEQIEAVTPKVTSPALSLVSGGKLDDDLVGGIGAEPSYFSELKGRCGVAQQAVETGGKDHPEPLWKALLHLAAHCDDGADWIDAVGKDHPDYSAESTRIKFNQRLEQKAQSIGPTTCDTFDGFCHDICKECGFRGGIKTPWVLGRKLEEDTTAPLPGAYFQNQLGVWRKAAQEGDDPKMVLPYVLTELTLYADQERGLVVSFVASRGAHNHHRVEVPYAVVGSPQQLVTILSKSGIAANKRLRAMTEDFLQDYIHYKQLDAKVNVASNVLGWNTSDPSNVRFVVGDWDFGSSRLDGNKLRRVVEADSELSNQYIAKGVIGPWRDAVAFLNKQGEIPLNLLVASSFAAPLMVFTGVAGLSMSFASRKSGTGKSSAMQVAQAVWGHPVTGVNSLNDTVNSVTHKMGMLKNYPVFWDELRMAREIRDYVQLTFQLSQGRGKQRLQRDITTRKVQTWETLLISASNESLVDHIRQLIPDSDAGMLRIMEFQVNEIPSANIGKMMKMFQALKNSYGNAGLIYGEYLAENAEKVQDLVHEVMERFTAAAHARHDERFWVAGAVTLISGMTIANKLDLADFDIPRITKYLLDWFPQRAAPPTAAEVIAGDNGPSPALITPQRDNDIHVMSRYMDINADHTVTFSQLPQVGSKASAAGFSVLAMPNRHPILCAYSQDGFLIRKLEFHSWLYENNYMPSDFHRSLLDAGASQGMYRIGMGVPGASPGLTMCYRIDKGSEAGNHFF